MSPKSEKKPFGRFNIICIAVTSVLLLVLFSVFLHQRSEVAPVYELTVSGLNADNPADAQALCRSDYVRYAEYAEGKSNVSWVWCGDTELYLVKTGALTVCTDEKVAGFTYVRFFDGEGESHKGFIIDPAEAPRELARVRITDAESFTFENVSMSIRVALRSGEISPSDAVWLWEDGSDTVYAVNEESCTPVAEGLVRFTDDGGILHICRILDTKLD